MPSRMLRSVNIENSSKPLMTGTSLRCTTTTEVAFAFWFKIVGVLNTTSHAYVGYRTVCAAGQLVK
jgi:hypothetical protein